MNIEQALKIVYERAWSLIPNPKSRRDAEALRLVYRYILEQESDEGLDNYDTDGTRPPTETVFVTQDKPLRKPKKQIYED